MTIHILHFCKNKQCNGGWLDLDLLKSKFPPSWKYCSKCVEAGEVNPDEPPKSYSNGIKKMLELNKQRKCL